VAEVETPVAPTAIAPPAEPQAPEAPLPVEPAAPVAPPAPIEPEEEQFDLSVLKKLTAAQLREVIDAADETVRDEALQEHSKRVQQRVQTQDREAATAEDGRHTFYQQQAQAGIVSYQRLAARAQRLLQGETEAFADQGVLQDIDNYRNGAIANVVFENEKSIAPVRQKFLGDMTDEEAKRLEKPLYEDRRAGTLTQLPILFEIVAERAREEGREEGRKLAEKSREAKKELVEQLRQVTAVKKQAPGVTPNGRAKQPGEDRAAVVRDMQSIDVSTPEGLAEWRRRERDFQKSLQT